MLNLILGLYSHYVVGFAIQYDVSNDVEIHQLRRAVI